MKGHLTNNYKFVEIFDIFGACRSQTPTYAISPAVVAKVSYFSMLKTSDATCVVHNCLIRQEMSSQLPLTIKERVAAVIHTGVQV